MMTMKRWVYRFLDTRAGRALRRRADRYLADHPRWREIDGVKVKFASLTDLDVNRRALRTGLGYNSEWVLNGPTDLICDVGCNTGLFALWVMARTGFKPQGIAIDANPAMVDRSRQHYLENDLRISSHWGFVGEPEGMRLHRRSISLVASSIPDHRARGDVVDSVTPPSICVRDLWRRKMGDCDGDLLKVDIEGSEFGLFMMEPNLASVFKRVVVEWHAPLCDLTFLRNMMWGTHVLVHFEASTFIGYAYFERMDYHFGQAPGASADSR